jgi:hypothetical protein
MVLASFWACTTVASGPRLSPANVRRIADSQAVRILKIDLHRYHSPAPFYVPNERLWSVAYYDKIHQRLDFSVQVHDKTKEAFVIQSDAGAFDGIK